MGYRKEEEEYGKREIFIYLFIYTSFDDVFSK